MYFNKLIFLQFCSFICEWSRPGDSEMTFAVFRVKLPPVTTSLYSKVEAIPLSALPKDTTSELALSSHHPF